MHLQITTEAIGIYSPEEMRSLIYNVNTPGISIGIKEMIPSGEPTVDDIKVYQYLIEKQTKIPAYTKGLSPKAFAECAHEILCSDATNVSCLDHDIFEVKEGIEDIFTK